MTQMELFREVEDYVADTRIVGNRLPVSRHSDSSVDQLRRPFIFWDGEGYTDETNTHHYWLLANSVGDKLVAPPGRSLERHNIARLFLSVASRYSSAIHCGFALGYDFTCILRGNGLTNSQYRSLYDEGILREPGYIFRLMMGKQLTVWENYVDLKGSRFNLQDSWGFFQRSFVKAMDEYFGTDWKYRDTVVAMKQQRGSFDREHDQDVMRYNDMELELGVMLMEELRDRLYNAGMPISRWYGPGAIANGLMQRWKIKQTLVRYDKEIPDLSKASQHAYAGGRFELFKPGHMNHKVYQYDINSAYPFAIAQLPNLAHGHWEHVEHPSFEDLTLFSLARVDMDTALAHMNLSTGEAPRSLGDVYPESIPFPLWRRTKRGSINYGSFGISGWYYQPELAAALYYVSKLPKFYEFSFDLKEAWIFRPDNPSYYYTLNKALSERNGQIQINWDIYSMSDLSEFPFSLVPTLYSNRQKLKRMGNGAHIGIKLGLNSLYGKFAQQISYDPKKDNIPPYHNLVLAGWITAMCRAQLLRAMALNPQAIIATETDGIFSLEKLDLPIGNGLGEWELTEYDDMHYYASGFRFGIAGGEIQKPATRGIPARDISLDTIRRTITNSQSVLSVEQTQFITTNWAVAMNRTNEAGNWRTLTKELRLMCEDPTGKRVHDWDCPSCVLQESGARSYGWDGPHLTVPSAEGAYTLSVAHKLAWQGAGERVSGQDDGLFQC